MLLVSCPSLREPLSRTVDVDILGWVGAKLGHLTGLLSSLQETHARNSCTDQSHSLCS